MRHRADGDCLFPSLIPWVVERRVHRAHKSAISRILSVAPHRNVLTCTSPCLSFVHVRCNKQLRRLDCHAAGVPYILRAAVVPSDEAFSDGRNRVLRILGNPIGNRKRHLRIVRDLSRHNRKPATATHLTNRRTVLCKNFLGSHKFERSA